MTQRVLWTANADVDGIELYQVERSPDDVPGNFVLIASVLHDKVGSSYIQATNQFFYDDTLGTLTDFYRLRAKRLSDGVFSAYTPMRQVEPIPPPLCRVYGRISNVNGVTPDGSQIIIRIVSANADDSGQFVGDLGVHSTDLEVFTDIDGDWEADLVQGAVVEISMPTINLVKRFTVPATNAASLISLI